MNVNSIERMKKDILSYIQSSNGVTNCGIKVKFIDKYRTFFPFTEIGENALQRWIIDYMSHELTIKRGLWGENVYFAKQKEDSDDDSIDVDVYDDADLKRKAPSPIALASPDTSTPVLKRPKSVPGSFDFEEENKYKQVGGRKSRQVQFKNQERSRDDDGFRIPSRPVTRSRSENRSKKPPQELPHYYNCTLIGDDFFIGLAVYELKYKSTYTNKRILKCGLCISGQTIADACKKLENEISEGQITNALVYLGSLDIIKGKQLIEMMNDYDKFLKICEARVIKVVACTLAPIPGFQTGERKDTLEGFNQYLKKKRLAVIDINKIFKEDVSGKEVHKKAFYTDFKPISGATQQIMFWNGLARKTLVRVLYKNLGFALVADDLPKVFPVE